MKKSFLHWSKRLRKMERDHLVTLDHKDCGELADIIDAISKSFKIIGEDAKLTLAPRPYKKDTDTELTVRTVQNEIIHQLILYEWGKR